MDRFRDWIRTRLRWPRGDRVCLAFAILATVVAVTPSYGPVTSPLWAFIAGGYFGLWIASRRRGRAS